MRDMLPDNINENEYGIINLGSSFSSGFHQTCYCKIGNVVYYFDYFGDANPPIQLIKYLVNACKIHYNVDRVQTYKDPPIYVDIYAFMF